MCVSPACIYLCSHAVAIGLSQSGGNALLAVLLTTAFLVLFGGNLVILGMLYREKTKNLCKDTKTEKSSQVSIYV